MQQFGGTGADGSLSLRHSAELDYGGYVRREPNQVDREGPWAVPRDVFPEDTYPAYATGAGYVLSLAAASCVLGEVGGRTEAEDTASAAAARLKYGIGVEDVLVGIVLHDVCPFVKPVHLTGVAKRPSEIATNHLWHWWNFGFPARLATGQVRISQFPPFLFHHLRSRGDFEEAAAAAA